MERSGAHALISEEEDLMREAMNGAQAAPHVPHRRVASRLSVLASTLGIGLLTLLSSAQAASAQRVVLESASPSAGCPGEHIILTGKGFGNPGRARADFTASVPPFFWPEEATVTSSTSAKTVVPVFLTVTSKDEQGHVRLDLREDNETNRIPFTL